MFLKIHHNFRSVCFEDLLLSGSNSCCLYCAHIGKTKPKHKAPVFIAKRDS